MKERTCKNCKSKFKKERELQYLCNNGKCVYEYANKLKAIKEAKEQKQKYKELKEKVKTKSDYINEL